MSATLFGTALIGTWYVMKTKMPSKPNRQTAQRNDTTKLIKRVQPSKRNTFHPFNTGLAPTDKHERIFNYGCPAWKDKTTINNYIKMKDDIWLDYHLTTDSWDNRINERNPNPVYNGAIIPLGKKPTTKQDIVLSST